MIAITPGYNPRDVLEKISDEVGRLIEKPIFQFERAKEYFLHIQNVQRSSRKYGKS